MSDNQIYGGLILMGIIAIAMYFVGRSDGMAIYRFRDNMVPSDEPRHPRYVAGFKAGHKKGRSRRVGDKKYAAFGRVAMRFVDRAGDVHPGIDDAETICKEFHEAMSDEIERWLPKELKTKGHAKKLSDTFVHDVAESISKPDLSLLNYFEIWSLHEVNKYPVLLASLFSSSFDEACKQYFGGHPYNKQLHFPSQVDALKSLESNSEKTIFEVWYADHIDGKYIPTLLGRGLGFSFSEACENLYETLPRNLRNNWNVEKTKYNGSPVEPSQTGAMNPFIQT